MSSAATSGQGRLTLAAMVFAVSMIFIDMTIVSIAIPELQKDLGLSSTGVQWIVNAYLLSTAALIAFGGKLGDLMGHRRMAIVGIVIFATSSALCGATPAGAVAEPWIITFRVVQGAGGALLFPAALTLVIGSFPLGERGRATAVFFGVTGAMTAVGPVLGGVLSEWTWRSIFWVNVPVSIIALILTFRIPADVVNERERIDVRGLVLIVAGMGLAVLGLQQASVWGWTSPATIGSITAGAVLLAAFVLVELRTDVPLIRMQIYAQRAFAADNAVLFFAFMVFIPLMFFASTYSQIALGWSPSNAGTYLLIIFGGFMVAAQIGGRMLDRVGARPPVVLGCALGCAGLVWWASTLTDLSVGSQWPAMVLTGAGLGLVIGQANTDAIDRGPRLSRGEVTGITQTVRNFGASVGMAVLGTILITATSHRVEASLESAGLSASRADEVAAALSQSGGGDSSAFSSSASDSKKEDELASAAATDFAEAQQVVYYAAAGMLAVGFAAALVIPPGCQEEEIEATGGTGSDAGVSI